MSFQIVGGVKIMSNKDDMGLLICFMTLVHI